MANIMALTDDQDMNRAGYSTVDWGSRDDGKGKPLGFIKFAYKLLEMVIKYNEEWRCS